MAGDFVIAAESAKWGMPEVDVDIAPGWGGTTRLARLNPPGPSRPRPRFLDRLTPPYPGARQD